MNYVGLGERKLLKRIFSGIMLTLLLTNILASACIIHLAGATQEEIKAESLRMTTIENITILENGTAQVKILINASSPLAEMYRKVLAAPPDAGIGEEMQIPENATEKIDTGENVTDISIPVRDGFYKSLVKEQLLSLGLRIEVSESKMVPRGERNECRVLISALGSFEIFNVTNTGSCEIWEVGLGPFNVTGITGLVLTRLMFTQMMLGSLPGEQAYQNIWRTRIELPENASLLNSDALPGLNWAIDFGGGTYLATSVGLDGTSAIMVEEQAVITEKNITATLECLHESLFSYKTFKIKYLLPNCSPDHLENRTAEAVNTNWRFETGWVQLPEIPLSQTFENKTEGYSLTLKLTLVPRFNIVEDIGWQWSWRLGWPPIHFDKFWANTTLQLSTKVRFEITANYNKTWEWHIYEKSLMTFWFYCGVPVWIDLRLGIDAVLKLDAEASLIMETTVKGNVTTGVIWDNGNWSWPQEFKFDPSLRDFAWNAYVKVNVIPSIRFRLEFMFYSVAGPFVELEPYANIKVIALFPDNRVNLTLSLNFKVNVGVKFASVIKDMLRVLNAPDELIRDQSWTIYDKPIPGANWSWNWTLNATLQPPSPIHDLSVSSITVSPPTIYTDTMVNINATIRNNGGYNETSDVTLFQNGSPVGNFSTVNFTLGKDICLPFIWNTSGLIPNSYTLKVKVDPVANEINRKDNEMNVTVYIIARNDIALFDVAVCPNEIYAGRTVNITVTVKNVGELSEDINVTVNCNETAIHMQFIKGLTPKEETVSIFLWNTTGLTPGQTYIIWANATTLHCDINVTNNVFISNATIVKIKMLGDVNGDGVVDISDLVIMVDAIPSVSGMSNWNPDADINNDGLCDVADLVKCIAHIPSSW